MAYATYTTEALVCGSYNSYTSDRSYLLFTKEAGMLFAQARSVREEKSKQRQALQDFSFVRVSLVKGKTGWRIGSVEALGNVFLQATTRIQRGFVAYVVQQLRRYVHGESDMAPLYEDVHEVLTTPYKEATIPTVQLVFTLRLLALLGYVAPKESYTSLLMPYTLAQAVDSYSSTMQSELEKTLAEGALSSHL